MLEFPRGASLARPAVAWAFPVALGRGTLSGVTMMHCRLPPACSLLMSPNFWHWTWTLCPQRLGLQKRAPWTPRCCYQSVWRPAMPGAKSNLPRSVRCLLQTWQCLVPSACSTQSRTHCPATPALRSPPPSHPVPLTRITFAPGAPPVLFLRPPPPHGNCRNSSSGRSSSSKTSGMLVPALPGFLLHSHRTSNTCANSSSSSSSPWMTLLSLQQLRF
mmetsp:Transcript_28893/g.74644  ORF Transcript_28893/g.74644 Transcript_28893/m.74644 type:complete len:217 (-) Transcript_28893:665-1315(-)